MGKLVLLSLLLVFALPALAEVGGGTNIQVNNSKTITFPAAMRTVLLINESTSAAPSVYFRLFYCGETPGTATQSSPIRLDKGEFIQFLHDPREPGGGYCAFSAVSSAGQDNSTIRYVIK